MEKKKQKLIPKNQNPSNPLQTYLNSDAHKIYQRDIPSNEADPIGELFVEGAIFGKPLELAGKYIAKPLLKPVINKINNKFGLIANNIQNKYYSYLVNRAKQKNPVELHKSRINYNWDKIPSVDNNSNKVQNNILYKSNSKEIRVHDINKDKDDFYESLDKFLAKNLPKQLRKFFYPKYERSYNAILSGNDVFMGNLDINKILSKKNLMLNQQQQKRIYDIALSHEIDHAIHVPIDGNNTGFNLLNPNLTELAARGSQLKDYFGFNKDQNLTSGMLKYAKQHYIEDTNIDNKMSDFFEKLTDYEKAAKWLSKNSTIGLPFTGAIGYQYNIQNKNN